MATQRLVIPGIVKNGLVVPQNDTPLPEGAHVDILIGAAEVTPALQAEYDQWEQASDEAWAMIDQWETEDQRPSVTFTRYNFQQPTTTSNGAADRQ